MAKEGIQPAPNSFPSYRFHHQSHRIRMYAILMVSFTINKTYRFHQQTHRICHFCGIIYQQKKNPVLWASINRIQIPWKIPKKKIPWKIWSNPLEIRHGNSRRENGFAKTKEFFTRRVDRHRCPGVPEKKFPERLMNILKDMCFYKP